MSLIILLTFFILFNYSSQQSCCSATSCVYGYQCFCANNTLSPVCLGQIDNNRRSFTINTAPRTFYFSPSEPQYDTIQISTCFNNGGYYGSAVVGINLESIDGIISNSNLTLYFTSLTSRCSSLKLSNLKFSKKSNGQFQSVIMFMSTTINQDISVNIQVQTMKNKNQSIVIPIAIGISTFVLTIMITLSVWCIYRRFRANTANSTNLVIIVPENAHVEVYMPALPLSEIKNRYQYQEGIVNCTVCLIDIEDIDSVRRSPCGHIFHQECIDQWCKKNLNCPLCRYPLDKESLKKQAECAELSQQINTNMLVANNGQHVSNN